MIAHMNVYGELTFRTLLLGVYASREVEILGLLYKVLNSKLIRLHLIKELAYKLLVVPMAGWAVVGKPLAPGEIETFFDSISEKKIAVGPCRCRIAHKSCNHNVNTDIVIKSGAEIWLSLFPDDYREISAEEAAKICKSSHREGMAQILYAHMDSSAKGHHFVVCNCCKDGCLPLLTLRFYGSERYPFVRGAYEARVDGELCQGCGTCVRVCPFSVRTVAGYLARVGGCFGCGLCATFCPSGATELIER